MVVFRSVELKGGQYSDTVSQILAQGEVLKLCVGRELGCVLEGRE